jgi:hypothetical protein
MKQPTRAGTDPHGVGGGVAQDEKVPSAQRALDVYQREPAGAELGDPRGGHGEQRAGGDDPVERSVLGQALGAVHCGQSGGVAEPGQPIAGVVDELGVDVD